MLPVTAWLCGNWLSSRCSLGRCSKKIRKPTISVSTGLLPNGGVAVLVFLWLERHKIINLTKTFLFSLFFSEYYGVFQCSLLDCSLVLFCFVLQTLYSVKYLFFTFSGGSVWKIIHGTGRSVRTIPIIFATSLHDCKIVNTDYLLTLFYLESRFHMESVWEQVVEIYQQIPHRNGTRKSEQAAPHFRLRLNDLGFFIFPLCFVFFKWN